MEKYFEKGELNMPWNVIFIFVFVFVLLFIIFLIKTYNTLVTLKQRVQNSWAQIDVQLKRRYDLIPNLVETVKGYAAHEKEVFQRVTEARAKAINAQGVEAQSQAENMLSGALKSLFAVVENYPELKANENFLKLQEELSNTEAKIAYTRQFYNDTVMKFNTSIQVFPQNLIAGYLGFNVIPYFEIEAGEREAVKVKF